jgi:signal transduction histidine kinase
MLRSEDDSLAMKSDLTTSETNSMPPGSADPTLAALFKRAAELSKSVAKYELLESTRRVSELAAKNNKLAGEVERLAKVGQDKLSLLRVILQQVPEGLVVCDQRGMITEVNAAAKRLAQSDPAGRPLELAPTIWGKMYDSEGSPVPADEWPWMRALKRGETTTREECRLVQSGGGSLYVLFSAVPITMEGKLTGALATFTDITQTKQENLASCGRAVDRERERIAAEIHDTLAQDLHAIMLQLAAAEHEIPESCEEIRKSLRATVDMARRSLTDARRAIWTLSEEAANDGDAGAGLRLLTQRLFSGTELKVTLGLPSESHPLPSKISYAVLRIAREALINVLKHSGATHVYAGIDWVADQVQLRIEDDGRGFAKLKAPCVDGGFGLISMRKRAEQLGGDVVVESHPGKGTLVLARFPSESGFSQAACA